MNINRLRIYFRNKLVKVWLFILYFIVIEIIFILVISIRNQSSLEVYNQPFKDSVILKKLKLSKASFVVVKIYIPGRSTNLKLPVVPINEITILPPGIYTDLELKLLPLDQSINIDYHAVNKALITLFEDTNKNKQYNPKIDKEIRDMWGKVISKNIILN